MASPIHVLCVDDDPDTLFVTALSMGLDETSNVRTALGGHAALALLSSSDVPVDCLLLDVHMRMSGREFLAGLRDMPNRQLARIVLLTTSVRPADLAIYLGLGAAGYITKPYDPLTLAIEVRQIAGLQ